MAKFNATVDYYTTSITETRKGQMIIDHGSKEAKKEWVSKVRKRQQALRMAEEMAEEAAERQRLEECRACAEEILTPITGWGSEEEAQFQRAVREFGQLLELKGWSTEASKPTDSRVHGVILPQAITNSRWWQEGVSIWNGEAVLNVELDKKETFLVHLDSQRYETKVELGYPVNGRDDGPGYEKAKAALAQALTKEIQGKVGNTYRHGEIIFKAYGVNLRHRRMNQPLTLTGFNIEEAPFDIGSFKVDLKFSLKVESAWKKIRGYGLKATLVPDDVFNLVVDSDKEWAVLHSMSGLKGKPLDLVAFAHVLGGAEVNPREGVIVPTEGPHKGKAFDISKADSVVDRWRNATAEEVTIHFDYAKAEWEFIKECDVEEGVYGTPEYDVVNVVEVDDDTVRISARIQMLVAEMPLNVEVSLPEESSGRTQLTPEMMSVLALQNRSMGEAMNKLGAQKRNSISRLLKMFKGKTHKDTPTLNIQDQVFLQSIQDLLKDGMNDADVMRAYEARFPHGAVFKTSNNSTVELFLDFKAIQGIAPFVGGSGEGVAHSIAEFLRTLPTYLGIKGQDSLIHERLGLLNKSTHAWFQAQLDSKSLRKKLVSGLKGTAFGSKIRTLAIPELSHEGEAPDCLPKVAINPKDNILWEMARSPFTGKVPFYLASEELEEGDDGDCRHHVGWRVQNQDGSFENTYRVGKEQRKVCRLVFDPYKMTGQYVTVFRTPMPMQGACEIVVTNKVAVGHLGLLMHIWAYFNEGDSDGDGVAIIPAFHYLDIAAVPFAQRYMIMVGMNKHPMGMGGYVLAYGVKKSKLPCAEFCSYFDAWLKKAVIVLPGSEAEATQIKKGILPYSRNKAVRDWCETVGDVSGHYRQGVSTAYNIAVIAVNTVLDLQYKIWNGKAEKEDEAKLSVSMKACAVSWRLLYEGLGLGGFSPKASRWFKLFRLSSFAAYFEEGAFGPKPAFDKTPKEDRLDILQALAEGAGYDHREDAAQISAELARYAGVLADIGAVENPTRNAKLWEEVSQDGTRFWTAVIRRTQRLCSQGTDEVLRDSLVEQYEEDYSDYSQDEEGPTTQSTTQIFVGHNCHKDLYCNWQAQNLRRAAVFNVQALEIYAQASAQETSPNDF